MMSQTKNYSTQLYMKYNTLFKELRALREEAIIMKQPQSEIDYLIQVEARLMLTVNSIKQSVLSQKRLEKIGENHYKEEILPKVK